jgi:hypothetical protein
MDRIEYLVENSHNQDFLYCQLVHSKIYILHAIDSQDVQRSVIQPAILRNETNFQSIRGRVLQNSRLPPDLHRTSVKQFTLNVIENGGIVPDAVTAYVNGIVHPQTD